MCRLPSLPNGSIMQTAAQSHSQDANWHGPDALLTRLKQLIWASPLYFCHSKNGIEIDASGYVTF